jgi:uncharacterized small protein (DUF1192 family)
MNNLEHGAYTMDPDDLPKKRPDMVIGENLDMISLTELAQRIDTLESEINRTRAEIAKKQSSRSVADAFFASKPQT